MRHPHGRGFSLVEIIVSIFIASILLILFQATMRGSTLAETTKSRGIALAAARSELERVRDEGYDALPQSGTFSDDSLAALPGAVATRDIQDYNAGTKQITVRVEWRDPGSEASSTVSLGTLITRIGGLP